jgi:fatty-acyl-CoA synthase
MSNQLIARSPSAYAYPLLIKQLLHTPLAHAPEQEIVYRGERRHSYRELRRRIGCLASALSGLGVRAGETVAVMDWDSHRYLEAYFAVPMMGAVLMTVNIRLSPEQVAYTLKHCAAGTVLVHADFLPLLQGIAKALPLLKRIILLADDGARPGGEVALAGEYEALLAAAAPDYDFPDFDENTRATTFYTTGTTGAPKGVYFSHRQLVLHTLGVATALALAPDGQRLHRGDVYMPLTPMFHVHAWGMPYIATLIGVKQVYPGRYQPELIAGLIRDEGVTFSHCVPTILQMVLAAPAAQAVDLSHWKVVIGGSAFTAGLCRQALQRGIDAFAGYGMSETCPILTLAQIKPELLAGLADDEAVRLRTKTGLPAPLVELRIVDADLNERPHDGQSTGEIVVRAPWLTQGYLNNPEASENLWRGGYLHTQDIGHIDAQGYLQVTDRIKDVIKTGGEWISSLELEYLISQHPAVAEVAVIGQPDDKWGERPLAIIVAREGQQAALTVEAIRAHVQGYAERGVISRYAVPENLRIVEAIEKTSVGKYNKKAMREKYAPA